MSSNVDYLVHRMWTIPTAHQHSPNNFPLDQLPWTGYTQWAAIWDLNLKIDGNIGGLSFFQLQV